MNSQASRAQPSHADIFTVVALGVLAYAMAGQVHEALGHGGACVLVGGQPEAVSTSYFWCETAGVSAWGQRLVAGGGILGNLLFGALSYLLARRLEWASGVTRYFAWLLFSLNLMMAGTYPLVLALLDEGDVRALAHSSSEPVFWRVAFAAMGAGVTVAAMFVSRRELRARVPPPGESRSQLWRLTLVPYLSGAALFLAAGLRGEGGFEARVVIPISFTLLGTAPLLALPFLFPRATGTSNTRGSWAIPRSFLPLGAALLAASFFIGVLGRTLPLR